MITDLDHERSRHVLIMIGKIELEVERQAAFWKSYAQTAKGLPVPIHATGLAAAFGLALLAAQRDWSKDQAPALMLATLTDRLRGRARDLGMDGVANTATEMDQPWPSLEKLLAELIDLDRCDYRVLQAEALACLTWIKVLAAAKAPPEEEVDPDDQRSTEAAPDDAGGGIVGATL